MTASVAAEMHRSPRVFVGQPVPQETLDILQTVATVEVYPYDDRQLSIDELVFAARHSDYLLLPYGATVDGWVVSANPALRGVALGGEPSDHTVDHAALEAAGIPVFGYRPDDRPVLQAGAAAAHCDLNLTLIMSLAYRLLESDVYVRMGGFRQEMSIDLMAVGCTGKVVGLIGIDEVACRMLPRLQALEMTAAYTQPSRLPAAEEHELGLTWVATQDELLATSDFVCLIRADAMADGKPLGEQELATMKPLGHLVNTVDANLVEQEALLAALAEGVIGGAGLDVYWDEPPRTAAPTVPRALKKLDNVVLTPHTSGATRAFHRFEMSALARALVDVIAEDRAHS